MLFNSFDFARLVLVTFALYYLPFMAKRQVIILILSSLLFYASSQPVLVILLVSSATVNCLTSYFVVHGKVHYQKAFAIVGVMANLFILAFFKYSPLVANTFFQSSDSIGHFLLSIPLPVGISFYTFQGISLVMDVFKGKYTSRTDTVAHSFLKHCRNTLFFISFFPQLVAGPIVKAHEFLPQITKKSLRNIDWETCFKNLVMGYFLKMVIADNLKDFTFWIMYPYFQQLSSLTLLVMLFGYSIQIFADFAGYSLIAIGIAGLFGYQLKMNFNFPYIATSFSEFWKRWHISLSSFLKEYLYIPLGGNRKGPFQTYLNLLITMLLGGLWHGAAWSYAVWGCFHGLALAIERILTSWFTLRSSKAVQFFKGILIFCLVTWAWLLFKLPQFEHVMAYMHTIRSNWMVEDHYKIITYCLLYSLPVIAYHIAYLLKEHSPLKYQQMIRFDYSVYGFLLFMIFTNSGTTGAFIYFQF
ncbi:MBOAT family O-acyltransferase [Rapidithrix thailandica]|uniref:MBOAT family O-acyltransferase n=1 Tax=Rapidithrix thailandica TaxID=413964 RepID=A0AAW9S3B2_9BACT